MYILIQLLSFLLPFQLSYHFRSLATSVYGFEIDYLIPAVYVTDIVALLIIAFGLRRIKFSKKFFVYSLLFTVFVVVNILSSTLYIPAIYRWLKVVEMLLLGLVLINLKDFDIFKHFVKPLSCSVFIVCVLGILQYFAGGSIGGAFYFLGERSFLFNDPNIAPFPYSTFSHPNSFAGFLLVFGIFLLHYRSKFKSRYFWALLVLVSISLVLTNSLNVYLTIGLLMLLKLRENLLRSSKLGVSFGFFAFDFTERFITHRVELIKSSLVMIKDNFWTGVGLNNFIPNLVKVSNSYINAWELQPVHNIFLLVFSEAGALGLLVFCLLLLAGLTTNSYGIIAILFTGLSDHYWLTLQQNMLLFTYVLAISRKLKLKSLKSK